MRFSDTFIPYGGYWSTPFCKWQGSLSRIHPLKLAAECAARKLDQMELAAQRLTGLHFGMTVPQRQCFFGAPWIAAMLGADHITGPTISQACATSARVVASAAGAVSQGAGAPVLALAADRVSNGPHLYYPDPGGPGGAGQSEDWVWDNINNDPHAKVAMIETAENIAARFEFGRKAQETLTLHRHTQYLAALNDDRLFQKRYMMPVRVRAGRTETTIAADEGIAKTSPEAMARLAPVREGGTVTFASQTHPADGNAGMLLCARHDAAALSPDGPLIELVSYGEGRTEKAHMGMAVVPAARNALAAAGLSIDAIGAVKTHNPFAVNDLYFAQEFKIAPESMNNYGSSLIFGHPQGPTGLRLIIELIEEVAQNGGGYGLMAGCAAGDTGAAVVVKVH